MIASWSSAELQLNPWRSRTRSARGGPSLALQEVRDRATRSFGQMIFDHLGRGMAIDGSTVRKSTQNASQACETPQRTLSEVHNCK